MCAFWAVESSVDCSQLRSLPTIRVNQCDLEIDPNVSVSLFVGDCRASDSEFLILDMVSCGLCCFKVVVWFCMMCALTTNESRVEQRTILKFLWKSGHTPIQCWRSLQEAFGEDCFSKNTVRTWHKKFEQGRTLTKDLKRPGCPRTARTPEAVQQVSALLGQDCRSTVRELSTEIGVSKSSVHSILKKDLNLSKVAPKFILKLLTDEQKCFRMRMCQLNLDSLAQDNNFLSLIVSGDESWISVFEVETKQQSCEWVWKGDQAARPIKALRQRSTKKGMLTVFVNQKGVVLSEFADPGTNINNDNYCVILRRLKENIRRKRPELWTMNAEGYRTVKLHHDNAPCHTSAFTLGFIGESKLDMVPHPPYSPDLAVCDFFVFPRLKSEMCGHRFRNLRDMRTAVFRTLRGIPQADFHAAIQSLPLRWMKCMNSQGDYFEGRHVAVDPDDFGFELTWEGSDSEETEDSDDNSQQ